MYLTDVHNIDNKYSGRLKRRSQSRCARGRLTRIEVEGELSLAVIDAEVLVTGLRFYNSEKVVLLARLSIEFLLQARYVTVFLYTGSALSVFMACVPLSWSTVQTAAVSLLSVLTNVGIIMRFIFL